MNILVVGSLIIQDPWSSRGTTRTDREKNPYLVKTRPEVESVVRKGLPTYRKYRRPHQLEHQCPGSPAWTVLAFALPLPAPVTSSGSVSSLEGAGGAEAPGNWSLVLAATTGNTCKARLRLYNAVPGYLQYKLHQ